MIGLYFLLPMLYSVAKYENGKYLLYACVTFFIFGILFTTLRLAKNYLPFDDIPVLSLLNKINYELASYSGYFLLGYYLSTRDFKKIKCRYLLIALLIIIALATISGAKYAQMQGTPTGIFYGYLTLPVFLEAIIIFIIFLKLDYKPSGVVTKTISTASKSTFVIYLLHPFVMDHINSWFNINTLSFNTWLSVPTISLVVFAVCLIVGIILNKIPIVNKWLI